MKIGDDTNDAGIPTTVFKCEYCNQEFSICPAVEKEREHLFKGCSTPGCESYDASRDLDVLFMGDRELADHADKVGVVSFKKLRQRRKFQKGEIVLKEIGEREW